MSGNATENNALNNLKGKIVVIPTIDTTLTKQGFAADSKAVGDKMTEWELLNAPVDNLESQSTTRPLSANQGRVLKEATTPIDNLDSEATDKPLSANQGRLLNDKIDETTTPVDNLLSSSAELSLSANQGRVLDEKITELETEVNTKLSEEPTLLASNISSIGNITLADNITKYRYLLIVCGVHTSDMDRKHTDFIYVPEITFGVDENHYANVTSGTDVNVSFSLKFIDEMTLKVIAISYGTTSWTNSGYIHKIYGIK